MGEATGEASRTVSFRTDAERAQKMKEGREGESEIQEDEIYELTG